MLMCHFIVSKSLGPVSSGENDFHTNVVESDGRASCFICPQSDQNLPSL